MAQTNVEIITESAEAVGFEYDGDNLKTFAEWKKEGMSVKKGEKAFLAVDLWKPVKKKDDEEETDEKGKKKSFFIKKKCHLFTPEQVQEITVKEVKEKPEKKKAATSTKKKTTAKKATPVKKKTTTKPTKKKETPSKAKPNNDKPKVVKQAETILEESKNFEDEFEQLGFPI